MKGSAICRTCGFDSRSQQYVERAVSTLVLEARCSAEDLLNAARAELIRADYKQDLNLNFEMFSVLIKMNQISRKMLVITAFQANPPAGEGTEGIRRFVWHGYESTFSRHLFAHPNKTFQNLRGIYTHIFFENGECRNWNCEFCT